MESTDTLAAANKVVVRRLMDDVMARGCLNLLPALVAPEYIGHFRLGDHYGPDGLRIEVAAYRTAFPDLAVTLEDLLAEGDQVVRRFSLRGYHRRPFLDIPASGQLVVLRGMAIDRLAGGRLVESWVQVDDFPHPQIRKRS